MKYLLIFVAIVFIGCGENKTQTLYQHGGNHACKYETNCSHYFYDTLKSIIIDTLPIHFYADTVNFKWLEPSATISYTEYRLYDSKGTVAIRDSTGWHFYFDCSKVSDAFLRAFMIKDSAYNANIREKDSIINELLLIKANNAAYHYAGIKTPETFFFRTSFGDFIKVSLTEAEIKRLNNQ